MRAGVSHAVGGGHVGAVGAQGQGRAGVEAGRGARRPQVVAAGQRQLGRTVRGQEVSQRAGGRPLAPVGDQHHVFGGEAQAVGARRRGRGDRGRGGARGRGGGAPAPGHVPGQSQLEFVRYL